MINKASFLSFIASFLMMSGPSAYAIEDSLKKAAIISAKGSAFQADRLKIAAENLANEYSTSGVAGGDPYRRKIVIAENRYDNKYKANLLRTRKIGLDKSDFIIKYDPSHPAADGNGYVKYPNVSKEIERADASEAERSYEANLSVVEMSNSLIQKTVEAMK